MSIITGKLKQTMCSLSEKLEEIKKQERMNEATTNDILKEVQKVFEEMVNEFPEYYTMGSVDEDKNHTILLLSIQDREYKFEAIENSVRSTSKNFVDIYIQGYLKRKFVYIEGGVEPEGWYFTEGNLMGKVIKSKEDLYERLNKMLDKEISKIEVK